MKKILLTFSLILTLQSCAGFHKFTYDSVYKGETIRLICGTVYIWEISDWTNLEEGYNNALNKPEAIRTHRDIWLYEMGKRFWGK